MLQRYIGRHKGQGIRTGTRIKGQGSRYKLKLRRVPYNTFKICSFAFSNSSFIITTHF
jgi:hypothetical protein